MFEKIGRAAERMATDISMSRRSFFGRLGRGAMAAACAVGGVLLFATESQAAHFGCCSGRGRCPQPAAGCQLVNPCYNNGYGAYCIWQCPNRPLLIYNRCR
jgi:hypothetical protein